MKTIPAELEVPDEGLAAARLIFLHVAPGIVIMADFVLNASLTASLGWQATLALFIAWLVIGLPLLLGLHFYRGRKPNGRWSLKGVVITDSHSRSINMRCSSRSSSSGLPSGQQCSFPWQTLSGASCSHGGPAG